MGSGRGEGAADNRHYGGISVLYECVGVVESSGGEVSGVAAAAVGADAGVPGLAAAGYGV